MNKCTSTALLALLTAVLVSGCNTNTEPKLDATAAGGTGADTASATGSATGTATGTGTTGSADISSTSSTTPSSATDAATKSDLERLNSTVNIAKLPETMVICTVNGVPITVAQFKSEYRNAILSLQNILSASPPQVEQFAAQAKALNIALTAEETKKLKETARKPQSLEGKTFDKYLKERKMTEAQFDDQVIKLGLAFKVGSRIIEKQLLAELINRELMMGEAKAQNFYKTAYNRYVQIKDSPKYKKALEVSDQTPEEVKEDLIQGEMLRMVQEKIAKDSAISDKELFDFYQKNKKQFEHGEKLRLAHIVLAAPSIDNPPVESVKTQLKKQYPKKTDAELNEEVKVIEVAKLRLAEELIARASKGEDFKKLADENTEDMQARMAKTGGELGAIDVAAANMGPDQKALINAVKTLKPGQIAPAPVKTVFGYHVIKLEEKIPAGAFTFDEVKDVLKKQSMLQNLEVNQAKWLDNKRKSAKIVMSEEFKKASN